MTDSISRINSRVAADPLLGALGLVLIAGIALCSCGARQESAGYSNREWTNVRIEEPFREALLRHPALMFGGADLLEIAPGRLHLVAVGVTENKALHDSSPRARIDTVRIAQVKANQEAVRFAETQVEGSLMVLETQESSSDPDSETTSTLRIEERIVERAEGLVRRTVSIGTWYSSDQELFFYAVAVPVVQSSAE